MEKMQELYELVSKDGILKAKFMGIMNNAEKAGQEETKEKLNDFAREAGFDVTADEMISFFKKQSEKSDGELSDEELDMVAGGKTVGEVWVVSILSMGYACE